MRPTIRPAILPTVVAVAIGCLIAPIRSAFASEAFRSQVWPLLREYCFDCHGNDFSEANLNLASLTETLDLARDFKDWDKVARMVRERKMPPEDAPAPSDEERATITQQVTGELERYIAEHAGDPGPIVVRRLTSAEYYHTIHDLTGLELQELVGLIEDAAAGEGFTNTGAGQFMQDSALERYLEAAKRVADHAVIGAGPLDFFPDAGETGRELSAIARIGRIYREHGFRTSAGEGAEPFGLDLYGRAMFVAWQYRYRDELQSGDVTLPELARREGLSERFCRYVADVLNRDAVPFPLSIIVQRWRAIGSPETGSPQAARAICTELGDELREWQGALAASADDEEEAAVLTAGEVKVAPQRSLTADIDWSKKATVGVIELSVLPASLAPIDRTVVLWQNPRMRFRLEDGRRLRPRPLREVVTSASAERLRFGESAGDGATAIGPEDFATAGQCTERVEFTVPPQATSGRLTVDVKLVAEPNSAGIVRCRLSDGHVAGETAAEVGATSTLLAVPDDPAVAAWQNDVAQFARLFPEVSHREPAPSDRDPIPAPYDNTYNKPERNHFHTAIKYARDDAFFVNQIADDATRRRLDQAWTDLLTSFNYHAANLRFLASKYSLELTDREIADVDPAAIGRLADEPRGYAQSWMTEHAAMQQSLRDAEPGHLEDALRFAERAWRRPLSLDEQVRLRSFYRELRTDGELAHRPAVRALLARVLVAPAFLYRLEPPAAGPEMAPLTDWQLAARLSYFLWSSMPDEELQQAAAEGRLSDAAELERHARRLLRDPKARRFAEEFFGQWLGFYRFDTYRGIDAERFPEFTAELQAAMYEEALRFFEHIVRDDRPVDEILFADYSFLNEALAAHYGLQVSDRGAGEFRQVTGLVQHHRGGLLGLGAILTATSAPLRTSPVKRGDWVLRRIIGSPVPPPPPDAGSIPADDLQADGLTLRRRLEAHRAHTSCVGCHSRIDPLGFALENFDPIGRWRDTYRDRQPIDVADTLSDGTVISGPDGLRAYLRRERGGFHRTISVKLLGYALGRSELASDRPLIEQLTDELNDGRRLSLSDLAVGIVTSKQFRRSKPVPLP